MEVVYGIDSYRSNGEGACVTVGTFDGLHVGHRLILSTLKDIASREGLRSVVVTFDPHPRQVLAPDKRVDFLLTQSEKIEAFRSVGIDVLVIHPFSMAFASLRAEAFLQDVLCNCLDMKYLVKGFNNHFGSDRLSDLDVIRSHGSRMGFGVTEVAPREFGDVFASSSLVRQMVREGRVDEAAGILGYRYFVAGDVIHGRKIGRTIGFPTANVSVDASAGKMLPAAGAYVASVSVFGNSYPAMVNIGSNPTVNDDGSLKFIEVHLLDFQGDLYGEKIRVDIIRRIRGEHKFPSLNALCDQLKSDVEQVRAYFPIISCS